MSTKFAYVKYFTGEKETVPVHRIKGFNVENINYEKKYKILWNKAYYDGIIIFVAESEEALEEKIEKDRPRLRPMVQYTSESDTGYKASEKKKDTNKKSSSEKEELLAKKLKDLSSQQHAKSKNNIDIKKNSEKEELLSKKLKDLSSSQKEHAKSNNKEERLQKEVESLRRQIADLKNSLQDKDDCLNECLKLNFALQKDVIEEIKELKNITEQKTEKNRIEERDDGTLFPVGHRRETDNNAQIHIGRNIWISSQVYDSAVCISKSPSVFTKNMALAIFGAQVLQESSVTGTVSNRNKKKKDETPRQKLDSQRLLALKDIVRYWLRKVKQYDEVAIDLEVNLVGKHVSHKIYELNRLKHKQTDKQTAASKNTEITSTVKVTDDNISIDVINDPLNNPLNSSVQVCSSPSSTNQSILD